MTDIGYMRLKQVLDVVPICRTAWYEGVKGGHFPAPVKVGRMSFWKKGDILDLVSRIDNGDIDSPKSETPRAATLEVSKKSQPS